MPKYGLTAGAAMLVAALGVQAQAPYPDRTVRIVVPFSAGGGTDVQARIAAARLSARFKQPFIVENRAGAGGNIGTAAVAQSAADGYTLLFVTPATVINQTLYAKPGYGVKRDFAAVASWATSPLLIIAATSVPATDLKSLVAYAKANPGKLSFASGGTGLITHLVMEFFKLNADIDLLHVPYGGQAPALAAVAGGQVSLTADSVASSMPSVKSGRVRALASTAKERAGDLKDIATVGEAGFPDLAVSTWYGLVAPVQTPTAVLDALHAAVNESLGDPDTRVQIEKVGADPNPTTRAEYAAFLELEGARWAKVLNQAKIRLE